MTTTVSQIGKSPFNDIRSFTALACGLERVTSRDPVMDLQLAIDASRKLHETLVCAKGAQISGGDPTPIIADAMARLPEVANAMDHFADPIVDDAARTSVEGKLEAAE